MKSRKLEIAILEAKRTNDIRKMDDIKLILEHKKRVLDMNVEYIMSKNGFERKHSFKEATESYSDILRLHRLVGAYAGS